MEKETTIFWLVFLSIDDTPRKRSRENSSEVVNMLYRSRVALSVTVVASNNFAFYHVLKCLGIVFAIFISIYIDRELE